MSPRPPGHHHVPSSSIAGFIDPKGLEALVAPLLHNPEDASFLVRCMVGEGPVHHRGANWVLLTLLGRAAQVAGAKLAPAPEAIAVPLRLPPHVAHREGEQNYPLGLSLGPLARLAKPGSREFDAMVDCLTDGPPQHTVANVTMLALLGTLLDALEER